MSENSKECLANSHCQKKVSCDSKILMWHTVPPWHAPQGHKLHGVHWQSAPYGQIGLQSGATGATWNSAISSQVHYLHYQFKICGFPTNLSKSHSTLWELAAHTQASEKLPAKAACGKTCKRSHSTSLRVPDPWVQIDQRHAHVGIGPQSGEISTHFVRQTCDSVRQSVRSLRGLSLRRRRRHGTGARHPRHCRRPRRPAQAALQQPGHDSCHGGTPRDVRDAGNLRNLSSKSQILVLLKVCKFVVNHCESQVILQYFFKLLRPGQ